jgi:hypothetical protein
MAGSGAPATIVAPSIDEIRMGNLLVVGQWNRIELRLRS